jgi:hypothetical protein
MVFDPAKILKLPVPLTTLTVKGESPFSKPPLMRKLVAHGGAASIEEDIVAKMSDDEKLVVDGAAIEEEMVATASTDDGASVAETGEAGALQIFIYVLTKEVLVESILL